MKYIFFLSMLLSFSLVMTSCGDDDVDMPEATDFDYHAHINQPTTDVKNVGDEIVIDIDFESHTGEVVHHVKVKIYNKDDNSIVVYDKPDDAHIQEEDGEYKYEDTFMLNEANGVDAHSDWILEASVWGNDGTESQKVETIEFHVHPE